MPRTGNPIRALVRLDDRLLGRWLDRPVKPLSYRTALIVTLVVLALLGPIAVLTHDIFFIVTPLVPMMIGLEIARRRSRA